MTKIIQLTDLHLFEDSGEQLYGVPTRAAVHDVLDHLFEHQGDFQRLILTGDLAHDERAATYRQLREMLGARLAHCRIIPGNHDDRASLREVFPEIISTLDGSGGGPTLQFREDVAQWRLIGLDSHQPGEVAGRIDAAQLDWLREQLADDSVQRIILFVHHPPVGIECPWLDAIGLLDAEPLNRLLRAENRLRAICVGHIHQEFSGTLGQATVWGTPSACLQFRPQTREPEYEPLPPGYRVLEFEGDTLRSRVVRLPRLKYPPEQG
jgi:Icc protein